MYSRGVRHDCGYNNAAPPEACRPGGGTCCMLCLEAARSAVATARALAILRFVDLEGTALKISAIQGLHGARCVSIRHLHESKAPRATRLAIGDQRNRVDGSVFGEQCAHGIIRRGEREITDV